MFNAPKMGRSLAGCGKWKWRQAGSITIFSNENEKAKKQYNIVLRRGGHLFVDFRFSRVIPETNPLKRRVVCTRMWAGHWSDYVLNPGRCSEIFPFPKTPRLSGRPTYWVPGGFCSETKREGPTADHFRSLVSKAIILHSCTRCHIGHTYYCVSNFRV